MSELLVKTTFASSFFANSNTEINPLQFVSMSRRGSYKT